MNKRCLRILILGTIWVLAGCSDYEMVRDDSSAPSSAQANESPVPGADSQPAGNKAVVRQGRTIRSDDGLCTVTVPPGWRTTTLLNPKAKLQVHYGREELYLGVLVDLKSDFSFSDLQEVYEFTHPLMVAGMTNLTETAPVRMKINGLDALRYEASGTKFRDAHFSQELFYLVTLVEGKEHYYQVVAWTLASRTAKNRPILESVANSFREIND